MNIINVFLYIYNIHINNFYFRYKNYRNLLYYIYIYIYITWYGYILIYFSLIFNTVVETREKKWGLFSKVG